MKGVLQDQPLDDLRDYLRNLSATPTASPASTRAEEGSSKVSEYTLADYVEEIKRMEKGDALRTPPVTRSQTNRQHTEANILDGMLSPVSEDQEEDSSMLGSPIIPMGDLEDLPDGED